MKCDKQTSGVGKYMKKLKDHEIEECTPECFDEKESITVNPTSGKNEAKTAEEIAEWFFQVTDPRQEQCKKLIESYADSVAEERCKAQFIGDKDHYEKLIERVAEERVALIDSAYKAVNKSMRFEVLLAEAFKAGQERMRERAAVAVETEHDVCLPLMCETGRKIRALEIEENK